MFRASARMASTKDLSSYSICLARAAMTPAQLLPRPSMTTQPPPEPLLGMVIASLKLAPELAPWNPLASENTLTSPVLRMSNWRLNSATDSQATDRPRSPSPHTAPRTPTMSGLTRANSSKSEIFK